MREGGGDGRCTARVGGGGRKLKVGRKEKVGRREGGRRACRGGRRK